METNMKKTTWFKRGAAALLAGMLAISLAACGTSEKPASSPDSTASTTSDTSQTAGPVTVKNASGEDITIKQAPQKIVALPVWEAEMVLDLVGTDRVAGLSNYIDQPALTALADTAKAVKGRVSSDAEAIVGLQPDLVLLDTFNDVDGSLTKSLKDAGITVLTLASPVTFEEIADRLTTVSKALFAEDKGQELVKEMNDRLDAVADKVKNAEKKTTVMYYEAAFNAEGMLCAYGEGSPFQAICEAAGVENVCDAELYSNVSKETVVNQWKPEVLVVSGVAYDANFQATEDGGAAMKAAIEADDTMKSVPAVENGRIFALTEKYRGSTSHYMAGAVEELAKACYPDLF